MYKNICFQVDSLIKSILKKVWDKKLKKENIMKKKKKVLYILLKDNDFRNINNLRVDCFSLCPILENNSDSRIIYPDPKKTFTKSPEHVSEK